MLYLIAFPTADTLIINTNWNVTASRQPTSVCRLSVQFHDSTKDNKFISSFRPVV